MEEMKNNISVPVPTDVVEKERKTYIAPSAEIILLAPKEMLAAVDFGFHNDNEANRWALNGWGIISCWEIIPPARLLAKYIRKHGNFQILHNNNTYSRH